MKLYIILTILLVLCSALTPFSSLLVTQSAETTKAETTIHKNEEVSQTAMESKTESNTSTIKILRTSSGKIIEKELFEYVKGSVAAEMPPTYEKEALKAQAVACYTYALWLKNNSDSSVLNGADISDSPSNYQGFLDDDELKNKWGENFDEYMKAVTDAVNEVTGEYIEYNGEPIMACYHAISTGKTESAKNAWGTDIPYLQSVRADGDILSPDIDSSVTLTDDEFQKAASTLVGADLSSSSKKWLGKLTRTKNGYVKKAIIGQKEFAGSDVRSAFNLRSPAFTVKKTNSGFIFSVKGYGHLVGMSQYSADYMARQGSDYKDILLHFYSGTKIVCR